jgi:hypothetical protein
MHSSDAVFVSARLSSLPPSASVQIVGLRRALRVVRALVLMLTGGFHVSTRPWSLVNVYGKPFCGVLRGS